MKPPTPNRLYIDHHLLDEFKREAKKTFPNEEYAVLCGYRAKGWRQVVVLFLWWPPDRAAKQTPFAVTESAVGNTPWSRQARSAARKQGLVVLGDIHSHTFGAGYHKTLTYRAPSEHDWNLVPAWWLQGIMVVQGNNGKRLRCSTKFWVGNPGIDVRVL